MKKVFAFALAAVMLLCVCSALAETDKEIQFSGHTFGETMEQSLQGEGADSMFFYYYPLTGRFIADPVVTDLGWAYFQDSIQVAYRTHIRQTGPKEVARHMADVNMCFYYPTAKDSADFNIKSGIFYAGIYEFYEDANGTFTDLKSKLSFVYGNPDAEEDSGDQIWGEMPFRTDIDSESAVSTLNEIKNRYQTSFVVWNSSANNASVVLEKINQDGWEYVRIIYIDLTANEK